MNRLSAVRKKIYDDTEQRDMYDRKILESEDDHRALGASP